MDQQRQNGAAELTTVHDYFTSLAKLVPALPVVEIEQIIDKVVDGFEHRRTIFVFGNGGSAASASHCACDLNKGTIVHPTSPRLKVIALTDNVPLLTAWANDSSYERVFAEQLLNFVEPGDLALAISGSGNSRNVLLALETAKNAGATTLGLTGYRGGKMKPLCDICVVVPSENMQLIEDMHHSILHCIFTVARQRIETGLKQVFVAGATSQGNTGHSVS